MDQINELYNKLITELKTYMHKEEDFNLIEKSFFYAAKKHQNQIRKSGEPYIIHPLNVAIILAGLHVMPNTICAGLLHDTVEDTDATLEDIEHEFGADIASIVNGVTKVTQLNFVSLEKNQAINHQKMIIAMSKDIRIIIVKLADRLHNMRTLEFQSKVKQQRIAEETIEIYAPLAHKLGMYNIKAELEDLSLKYMNPVMYEMIADMIETKVKNREAYIDKMKEELTKSLKENGVYDFEIKGRIKNIYSIYKKMTTQQKNFEDIYDIIALRIIVDKVETCYFVLGIIHTNYVPIQKRFKDYIAVPKPNMYQSLHSTILSNDGETVEIQIRTKEMDLVSEYGIAAHWAYKENVTYSKEKEQYEIAQKLKWYRELLQVTNEEGEDASTLVNTVKEDILDANIYVYTPKGEVMSLPKGATPLDFAYKIHTDIGNKTVGAIVNNKIVPLSYELQTGDIVSVRINKNSSGPSEDWLHIVKTNHAKQKIKNFLNKQNYDILVASGKNDLEKEMIQEKVEGDITDDFVKTNFSKNGITTTLELYKEIGKGIISPKTVIAKLLGTNTFDLEASLNKQMAKSNRILTTHSETGVVVEGLTSPQIKLATCCMPLPGDEIVGFISKGKGLVVHRTDCQNLQTLDVGRQLKLYWSDEITRKYPCQIKIEAANKNGFTADLITVFNSYNVNILQLNVIQTKDYLLNAKVKVLISNKEELDLVLENLKKVSGVYKVTRG